MKKVVSSRMTFIILLFMSTNICGASMINAGINTDKKELTEEQEVIVTLKFDND